VNSQRFKHALVVGGSGMLAGCCRKLLAVSGSVSVMARNESRIRAIAPAIVPLVYDYSEAKESGIPRDQTPDLIVAWIHGRMPAFRRALAERVCPGGRFVQVLGSAHGDPSRPERLDEMKAVADGVPLVYQAVVLGFALEGTRARWLTDDEISDGVFEAIEKGVPLSIVGAVEPWSAKP
jgi:hypothetical protein